MWSSWAKAMWLQRESHEMPNTFAPNWPNTGISSLNSPSSLVHTGVKSPG